MAMIRCEAKTKNALAYYREVLTAWVCDCVEPEEVLELRKMSIQNASEDFLIADALRRATRELKEATTKK